ncbi:hypothetical protein [Bacillus sp. M6-12]|uniref:hypothetical protein n=1 Tax=Bacillus sp. M6-12 TaxID=2054166 RepID=UPI0015E08BD6|nr:hypothetical protein [Bacillus sp. M6-12]
MIPKVHPVQSMMHFPKPIQPNVQKKKELNTEETKSFSEVLKEIRKKRGDFPS